MKEAAHDRHVANKIIFITWKQELITVEGSIKYCWWQCNNKCNKGTSPNSLPPTVNMFVYEKYCVVKS